ncbi:HAD-IIIC family phosphatase [Vibrio vulnificus]|uniref:HAD-IIIC family phosphatase n=1 Tax=Vibrio vulnificus TaxID=672 RepID=UPI0013EE783E|nr:HAD-IIIC family phosphatase [Vibrio vulnificus]
MFYLGTDNLPTLRQRLICHAEERPTQIAYRFLSEKGEEAEHLTYASLLRQAMDSARLIHRFSEPGDRILLLLPTGRDYIVSLWACVFAGVTAVPLYRPTGKRMLHRLKNIAADTRPSLILTEEKWLQSLSALSRQSPAIASARRITTEQLQAHCEEQQTDSPERDYMGHLPEISPDMPAIIQYSSGTTGVEKGVVLTHRNIAVNQYQISLNFRISPEEKIVSWLPLHHDMGLMGCVFQSLYAGATCILLSPESFSKRPALWLQVISDFQASISGAPDFAYRLCLSLQAAQIEKLDLSSWRIAFNGAEPVRHDTLTRFSQHFSPQGFQQTAFAPCYGLAEATLLVSIDVSGGGFHTLQVDRAALQQNQVIIRRNENMHGHRAVSPQDIDDDSCSEHFDIGYDEEIAFSDIVSCGAICEQLDLQIVVPGTLRSCREFEVGEVLIAGNNVTGGYWGDTYTGLKSISHNRDNEKRYLRTGDLGFVYAGELYITGRVKDLIIVRGQNYYPVDIEYTLTQQIVSVVKAAVWCESSITDRRGDVSIRPGSDHDALTVLIEPPRKPAHTDELFSQVKRVIGMQYELNVARVILVRKGGIPMTTSGKVKRWQCREWLAQDRFKVIADSRDSLSVLHPSEIKAEQAASMDFIDQAVNEVLQHILETSSIDSEQHFFEMGGTSLKASMVAAALEKKLDQTIQVEWLISSGSIQDFVANVRQHRQASSYQALRITDVAQSRSADEDAKKRYPLSLAQKRMWILEQLHPGNPFYITATETTLYQPLDYHSFRQAGQILLQRHEILRARFYDEPDCLSGITSQSFSTHAEFDCSLIRLDSCHQDVQAEALEMVVKSQVLKPFDFLHEEAFRAVVVMLAEEHYMIYLVTHHMVCDGYALGLLFQELRFWYQKLVDSKVQAEKLGVIENDSHDISERLPEIVPSPIQYRDYVQWQQLVMQRQEFLSEHEKYWHACYERPLPEPVSIADFPLSESERIQAGPFSPGKEFTITLPEHLSKSLSVFARERKISLFSLMLTAMKVLVYQRTGQQDIVIGTAVSGRDQAELSELIGCFINFLPLRSKVNPTGTWDELLDKVNATVVGGIEHQAYPYEKLNEYIQQNNHGMYSQGGGLPVYRVGLWFHDYSIPPLFRDSQSRLISTDSASLDLRVIVIDSGKGIDLTFEYIPRMFKKHTVETLSATYIELLRRLINQPYQPFYESAQDNLTPIVADKQQAGRTIHLFSSFNATPIGKILPYIFSQMRLDVGVKLHPSSFLFDQVLNHRHSLVQKTGDINVFLFRPEDWLDGQQVKELDVSTLIEQSEIMTGQFISALTAFAETVPTPVYVGLCQTVIPSLVQHFQWQRYIRRLRTQLTNNSGLNLLPLHVAEEENIADEIDYAEASDEAGLPLFPYVNRHYADISKVIARNIYTVFKTPRKVIVVDCDNTLWDGNCAEDGWENIQITPGRERIQTFLSEMKQRGYLLAICSHNLFDDVKRVFERRHEMRLCWNDFVSTRIDWQPKSSGLLSLADELNLGIDTFILIDDSPVNCALVRERCQEVFVLELPEEGHQAAELLLGSWEFDNADRPGEHDFRRTQQYRENRQRATLKHQTATLDDFLVRIEQCIDISEVDDLHRPHQLTLRVNQFNTSYQRFSISQLQAMAASSHYILKKVSVSDRFGDLGEVGFWLAKQQERQLIIESFLLSCRALGRAVEVAMLEDLLEVATARGVETLTLRLAVKARNEPARTFAASYFGLNETMISASQGEGEPLIELTRTLRQIRTSLTKAALDELATESYGQNQRTDHTHLYNSHTAPTRLGSIKAPEVLPQLAEATQLFTARYRSSRQLVEDVFGQAATLPDSGRATYVPPQTDVEKMLAGIWQDALGCESPGVQDNFFAAGYNSLEATQVIARIRKQTGIVINLADLLESPTISILAQHIEKKLEQWAAGASHQQLLEQAALLSDDDLEALLRQDD